MKIILTQDAKAGTYDLTEVDGSLTLTLDQPETSSSSSASSAPAPVSPALDAAVITGTVNGTAISLTVQPGECLQLVAANFQLGCVTYYADGAIVIENAYVGAGNMTPIDLPMSLTIAVGDQTFSTGDITLGYRQWTRPFWVVQPTVQVFDRSLFPYYGSGSESASFVDAYAKADNSILGPSLHDPHTADTGERGDLGLLPACDAAYLTNPGPEAAAVVRGMADASAPFPFHTRDTATNEMLLASNYPKASMLGALLGTSGNPFQKYTPSAPSIYNLNEAQAHAPAFNALASALFGTEYDKASLAQWANYVGCLWQNWGYRITSDGPTALDANVQTRGAAWGLRTIAQAARLSDHQEMFTGWVAAQASQIAAITAKSGMPMLMTDVVYPPGTPHRGYGLYQLDFVQAATGYTIQLGFTAFQPLLDYLAPLMTDRMLAAQHEVATIYQATYKDEAGNVATNWAQSLQFTAASNVKLAAALKCPEDSVSLESALAGLQDGQMPTGIIAGDFDPSGYPTSPGGTGYSAIYRGALAYTAQYATDQTTAQAAWTKFLKYDRENYAGDPKYNIVPKAA